MNIEDIVVMKTWDEAHMTPVERTEKVRVEQQKRIEEANARIKAANERYEDAKVSEPARE